MWVPATGHHYGSVRRSEGERGDEPVRWLCPPPLHPHEHHKEADARLHSINYYYLVADDRSSKQESCF